jgi:hypothetical protein
MQEDPNRVWPPGGDKRVRVIERNYSLLLLYFENNFIIDAEQSAFVQQFGIC